jgi:hypothetical protein
MNLANGNFNDFGGDIPKGDFKDCSTPDIRRHMINHIRSWMKQYRHFEPDRYNDWYELRDDLHRVTRDIDALLGEY